MALQMIHTTFTGALVVVFTVVSCASSAGDRGSQTHGIVNPTGACVAPNSGAIAGYSVPGRGDVWLLDCENPLRRDYFHVYAQGSAEHCYIIPRPDGAPQLSDACEDSTHELHPLVENHALCGPASTTEAVARINDMTAEDALTIARYLHTRIRFEPSGLNGTGIAPFPLPPDVLDACSLHAATNSAALAAACDDERARQKSGIDIGYSYDAVAPELAALLNELYGIP